VLIKHQRARARHRALVHMNLRYRIFVLHTESFPHKIVTQSRESLRHVSERKKSQFSHVTDMVCKKGTAIVSDCQPATETLTKESWARDLRELTDVDACMCMRQPESTSDHAYCDTATTNALLQLLGVLLRFMECYS
jgi:hypothetical protein